MGTDLHLQPTEGKLITNKSATNPVRGVRVVSATKDTEFSSSFIDLHYAYGGGSGGTLGISFDDIDMVVDALLEHQAARKGRLEQALTIGEAEKRRLKYRAAFMDRKERRKKS